MQAIAAQRSDIACSWERSQMCGLAPSSSPDFAAGPTDESANSAVLTSADPVLEEATQQILGTGMAMLLTDEDCTVLRLVDGSDPAGCADDAAGVIRGSRLGEDVAGTNAVGTAAELQRPTAVRGNEHYLNALKGFCCYARPLVHPSTGQLKGVVAMVGAAELASPIAEAFVHRVASAIERRLIADSYEAERRLTAAFSGASRRLGGAVCLVGEDVLIANNAALELIEITGIDELQRLSSSVDTGEEVQTNIHIADEREVAVTTSRVAGVGVVHDLKPLWLRTKPVPRRVPTRGPGGYVWGPRLRALRESTGAISLTGEAGSGRSLGALEVAKPHPYAHLDAADLPVEGESRWSRSLLELSTEFDGVLIVENAELLPPVQRALLARVLADPLTRPRLVITSLPGPDVQALRPLIARCAHHLELPPLRERIVDFPDLVASLAHEVCGHERFAFTASAIKALSTHPWPGNLVELRTVIEGTNVGRKTGMIGVVDLPDRYRDATHDALLGLERAERQAIIDALCASCGNKVRAAESLGISRTTLYRRMRALKVTD